MLNHVAHCSRQNASQMLLLSLKNSVEKLKRHCCGKKTARKRTRNRYSFVVHTLFTNTFEWVSTTSCKSFFSIKEPKQEQKYCNSQNILNYWQSSMAAGYPPDFSAQPSVARIHNKIKQMETPLKKRGNVDRLLFFFVILIFLSTAFCKKTQHLKKVFGCLPQSMTFRPISGKKDITF